MIVGAYKVNGFHSLFQFWSFRPIARFTSGLSETRTLLVKCVKRVGWPLLHGSEVSTEGYAWLSWLNSVRQLEDDLWPPKL